MIGHPGPTIRLTKRTVEKAGVWVHPRASEIVSVALTRPEITRIDNRDRYNRRRTD